MKAKRFLAVILSAILLLSCIGCKSDSENAENASSNQSGTDTTTVPKLTLLYSANDSLNPYKAESLLNRRLSLLMYDPLVKLDSKLQPRFVLADSIEFDGKDCVITLKNALFSDGTQVTAEDVVFSMDAALSSELTAFKQQLSNVKSYKADENGKFRVTLNKVDPYFANLLDFPIIKKGSDELVDENKIALPPVGSGAYIFDTKEELLTVNTKYSLGSPAVLTINLIDAPDSAVEKYNLEVGNVSIYYTDLSDGIVPPMSGNSSTLALNNLIYLGVNLNNTFLRKAEMRYALAAAIDRTAVCNDAYFGYATPALGLFNSVWNDAGSLQNLTKTADLENVVAILKDIGYNSKDEEGFFVNSKGKPITFKLIVNNENDRRLKTAELLKKQLETAGFKIELVTLEWDKYVEALTFGNFDLYLAETKLPNNMDVTELVTSNGSLSYGIPAPKPAENDPTDSTKTDEDGQVDETTQDSDSDNKQSNNSVLVSSVPLLDDAVHGFYNEKLSLVDIINAFNAEMPLIPVCHRQGLTSCSPEINAENMSSLSDAYFGIIK